MKTCLTLLALIGTGFCQAQTIFSTLGPGDSYIQNVGRSFSGVDNSFTHIHSDLAWQFTAGTGGQVGVIKVGVRYWEGTNHAKLSLLSDSGDLLGSTLGSWDVLDMPLVGGTHPPMIVDASASNLTLTAGTKYWLMLSPFDTTIYAAWMDNDQSMFGRMAWSNAVNNFSYVNNMPYSGFSVSAVPEPASLVLVVGLAAVATRKRRRN